MNTTPNRNETTLEEEARLTAFVLGELEEPDAAAFARRVDEDASLRREVEVVRRTVELTAADLERETVPGLTPEQRAAIERGPGAAPAPRSILYSFATMRNLWAGVGLAAAACLAVVLWPAVSPGPREEFAALEQRAELREGEKERAMLDRADDALGAASAAAPSDAPEALRRDTGIDITIVEEKQARAKAAGPDRTLASKQIAAPGSGGIDPKREQDAGAAPARAARERSAPGAAAGAPPAVAAGGGLARPAESSDDPGAEDERRAGARFAEPTFRGTSQEPRSTFAIDVPSDSYDEVRAALRDGRLPAKDGVRIEEMVNSFDYDYPAVTGDDAFALDLEAGGCPWEPKHRLVRIGLRGRDATGAGESPTIAEAVDLSVEFNPQRVESYRLIGYTNPELAAADVVNEHGAAGAVRAGQRATALYEFVPRGAADGDGESEMLTVRLRYQEPADGSSRGLDRAVFGAEVPLENASDDYRFAAAVAWFGLVLRDGLQEGAETFRAVVALAQPGPNGARAFDIAGPPPDRDEFIDLVGRARRLNSRLLQEAAEQDRDRDR